jgi:hypothetical protein
MAGLRLTTHGEYWRATPNVLYLPGRLGFANPRLRPSFCGGLTSSWSLSPETSSGEPASICHCLSGYRNESRAWSPYLL